jgi:polyisoprenoid-binding protein YceI
MRLVPCAAALLITAAGVVPAAQAALATYRLDPAKSTLSFGFTQAGARNKGRFDKFDVNIVFDAAQGQASRLDVAVQMSSLDTSDKDRDSTLRGNDLFDVAKFPQAHFAATTFTRTDATHFEAVGKLTIRDVTRELRVPFTFTPTNEGGRTTGNMSGQVVIKRLDFGVGQGDWKSTEWVGDEVAVSFALRLVAAPGS